MCSGERGIRLRGLLRRWIPNVAALWRAHPPKPEPEKPDYSRDDSLYPWLNDMLERILADDRCAGRPGYAWGLLNGAHLAKMIGVARVSALEFGVAGGNGLIALEAIAEKVEQICRVGIDVYGFDTGVGLPKPGDYRDMPNLYGEGEFRMDPERLRRRLRRAELVLGLVSDTVQPFVASKPSPVAFLSIDLDLYSSTTHALKLLEAGQTVLLPRIHCYFDDIMGYTCADCTGERLAVAEFNASHTTRKLSPVFGLKHFVGQRHAGSLWVDSFYMAHIFDHPLYGCYDGLSRYRWVQSTNLAG